MKISLKYIFALCALIFLSSCKKNNEPELFTILIDSYQDEQVRLSEISEEIKAIVLEIPDYFYVGDLEKARVLVSDDYIFLLRNGLGLTSIQLFDCSGKFIQQIGQAGHDHGKYGGGIYDIAADFENKKLYVQSDYKLICYNFDGTFVKEVNRIGEYLNFTNNRLTTINSYKVPGDVRDYKANVVLYEISDDLQIVDSVVLFSSEANYAELVKSLDYCHPMTCVDGNMYFYYLFPLMGNNLDSNQDTLYQLKDDELIPHLRVKLTPGVGNSEKNIRTVYIYRSSRFVFEQHAGERAGIFCYDLKTMKGKTMSDGYFDDIHGAMKLDNVKLLASDANKFYYLNKNFRIDMDEDEPKLTLYIGTLKK